MCCRTTSRNLNVQICCNFAYYTVQIKGSYQTHGGNFWSFSEHLNRMPVSREISRTVLWVCWLCRCLLTFSAACYATFVIICLEILSLFPSLYIPSTKTISLSKTCSSLKSIFANAAVTFADYNYAILMPLILEVVRQHSSSMVGNLYTVLLTFSRSERILKIS